ncbi:MAG: M23 family metallopeptidase [Candidatus Micrarchaeota archaeon]
MGETGRFQMEAPKTTPSIFTRSPHSRKCRKQFEKWFSVVGVASIIGCGDIHLTNYYQPYSTSPPPSLVDSGTTQDSGQTTELLSGKQIVYDATQWPTNNHSISSPFGPRLKASEEYRYDFHRGIDIAVVVGEPVLSLADGLVYEIYPDGDPNSPYQSGGNVVAISHMADVPLNFHGTPYEEYFSLYMHLDSIAVAEDQIIPGGYIIGTAGQSGETDFQHLHFEIRIGTICSREYQIAHPEKECASFFGNNQFDPHVNPFLFLPYDDANDLSIELLSDSPLTALIRSPRESLDFNRMFVRSGSEKIVDFNERLGIDPDDIDNQDYNDIAIQPAIFNTESTSYEITFELQLTGFHTIEATDIWGNGIRITR